MSQFIFPPLTASLDSESSDGGSLPSAIMIIGGYDGANTQVIKTDADGNLQVDILSSSTITVSGTVTLGAGTAAFGKLSANSGVDIGDVDVTSLPSIPSGTNSIGTVILGAGTAAIGKLVANSGVDIGDVDVTNVIPGVAATNLGKAIQSAQGTTDVGVAALVVRNDTLADLSGADGDYAPLQVNASGALYTSLATSLPAGSNAIGKLAANSGVDIGDVDVTSLPSIPAGTNSIGTVVLGAGTAAIGKLTANSGVDIGDVTLNAGTAEIGKLAAGTASIGTVGLNAGSNAIGKLAANSGVDIGDVDVLSLPALPAGTNSIGTVVVSSIAPVDFLDSGLINTSTANIASTGTTVVSSLAAACTEIEIQEDIGEFMSMRVGGAVKAYLPLGGGRVKVTLAATSAVQLYSETGTAISSGQIAINFLG